MLRVLNIKKGDKGWWGVLVEEDDAYRTYFVKGNERTLLSEYPKDLYSPDYRKFAKQLGKLAPSTFLHVDPIDIERLDEKIIREVFKKLPKEGGKRDESEGHTVP